MLQYAMIFLLIAVLAAVFGFGLTAVAFAAVAKVLFFLFLIGFVVTLIMHLRQRV